MKQTMKKYSIFMAVAALMFAVSCNKEEVNTVEPTIETELITVDLNPMTKTSLDGKATVWTEGDEVSVTVGGKNIGSLKLVKGTTSTFSGEVEAGKTGAAILNYPAGVTSVPTTQAAVAGSFANGAALLEGETTMEALRACEGASLHNTTALLQFEVSIAGNVAFTIGDKTYTIEGCEPGNIYYACVDPNTTGKLSYTVGIVLGAKEKEDFAPVANMVYPLGELTLKESTYGVVGDNNSWNDSYMYETTEGDNFFVLYNAKFDAAGKFKIRKDGKWIDDYNFGSVNQNEKEKNSIVGVYVDKNSNDIKVPVGIYDIYFNRTAGRVYIMESGKFYNEVPEPSIPNNKVYNLIGSFEGSNWSDIPMTYSGDGVWTIERTFKKDDQWKIRLTNDWGENWGYDNVHMGSNYTTKANDGNVIMTTAGTYVICFVRDWNTIRIVKK